MSDAPLPPSPDPFTGHLAFLARLEARLATPATDRAPIEPRDPIGDRVEDMLDFDALEAVASWQGLFRTPREWRPDELDPDVGAQMKECMPQFHLRNIGRSERLVDPDDDMELSHERVPYGLRADGVATEPLGPREAVGLLDEMNADAVRGYRQRMNWLIRQTAWSRHFCQELKESIPGPLWRYDADAPGEDHKPDTDPDPTDT